MNFDTIIVGGGLGGLTAGATLARFGKRALLLEQHYIPGGCATTFKRKDYIMEAGLHELGGLHETDFKRGIFDLLGIWNHVEFLQAPEFFRIKSAGFDVVVPHGKEKVIKELSRHYPDDEEGIRELLNLMEGVMREMPKMPKGLKAKLLYPLFPLFYPNITKASRYTVGRWLDERIKSEELRIILQGNLMYFHDDPYTMSLFYFSAAQTNFFGGGGHFVKGGSQKLSNYLAGEIERAGGQVLLGKKVNRLLVENEKVVGVQFQDAFNSALPEQKVYAPITIANAAVPLVKNMLPEAQAKKLGKKIDHLEEACSLISMYIGFRKDLKSHGVKHYSTFFLDDHVNSLSDFGELSKSADWGKKPFVFVDYSQIDAGLAPEGKTVGAICAVDYLSNWENLSPKEYKAEKERVAKVLLDRLDENVPGIVEHIEYYEVGTPQTIQSFTLNPKGTPYGYAQTPEQSGNGRLQRKSPIKNLHFASAWAMPGGGYPGAIISGFLCGLEVKEELNGAKDEVVKIADERVIPLIERKEIAERSFELVFEKPKGFEHVAGQYAILSLDSPKYEELDVPHRRLSMVSHPDEPHLRFAMRTSKSSYKRSCFAMKKGDTATIYGPVGDFVIRPTGRPIVFLIAGIGVTPALPLLKELENNNFPTVTHLFYSNFTIEQSPYHQDFLNINKPNFHYHPVFSDIDGLMNVETLKPLGDLKQYDFYIVGTTGFLNAMEGLLLGQHVPDAHIFMDDFG